ncbi:hypothetical protein [Streptomyces gobiensis]|uniref:hypothetical protein n=1 Tax=Streptomyces gobiensis TaxID=2875706 RepID=UPI001E55C1BA|nr:hypothetical protein [Streptomyces gobiensis]UGY92469.1 hypothetical protein test1122_12565 [Streptomyces gobiensis]
MSRDTRGGPAKRPRTLERARVGWPRALRGLKDLLYEVYLAAGTPSLDEIANDIANDIASDDQGLSGAPSRDTVRRVISDPGLPPGQADAVAVAVVLARRAAWEVRDLAGQVRALWVEARMVRGAGRPIGEFDDRLVLDDLEVHRALDAGADCQQLGALPAYVPRAFDVSLREVVDSAADGQSGIAVLVAGSSTGKTRALWEAIKQLPHPWRLWHPLTPTRPDAALAELPDIAPRTVVWLNEAQHYLTPDSVGERVAAGLRELLHNPARGPVLVLATLWPEHWDRLTTRSDPDRHAQARELLRGHMIGVPDAFTEADLAALADTASTDPRLIEAVERTRDAQITQYLAGVPVLMDRYQTAPAATRALIHAAMDARRLGAGPRIPLAWLADATPGYLTNTEYNALGDSWLSQALDYVTRECNGIRGILTPIKPAAPRNQRNRRTPAAAHPTAGQPARDTHGPQYQLADYLDQYGRSRRANQTPPLDFWTAAADHAHPADMTPLGDAAWNLGLYRDSAQLHKHATAHGNPQAAMRLLRCFQHLHPTDPRPAQWAAAHASLDDPSGVAFLLTALRDAGAEEQVGVLLDRDPAIHTPLDDPLEVAELLDSLREAGAKEQTAALAARAVAQVPLYDPSEVAYLLVSLREVGAEEQMAALAAWAVAQVPLHDPSKVAYLLDSLREAGAEEQVGVLLDRDPAANAPVHAPGGVAYLLDSLRKAGAEEQTAALAARAVAQVPLDGPNELGFLFAVLRKAGAEEQVGVLLDRDPAIHTPLDDPLGVAYLLVSLLEVGAEEQMVTLAARAVAQVPLDDPGGVAFLLVGLWKAGAEEQTAALAARAVAQVPLDDPNELGFLFAVLREVGAKEQIAALAARAVAQVRFDDSNELLGLVLAALREVGTEEQIAAMDALLPVARDLGQYNKVGGSQELRLGREPDGSATSPWTWEDLE